MERFSIGAVLTAGLRLGAWCLLRFAPLVALFFVPVLVGVPGDLVVPALLLVDIPLAAIVTHAVASELRGARAAVTASLAAGLRRTPAVLVVMAGVYVTAFALGFALIFPVLEASRLVHRAAWSGFGLVLVFLYSRWFVVVPAVVVERPGTRAFARSGQLTEGHRWQLASIVALYGATLVGTALVVDLVVPDLQAEREYTWTALWAVASVLRAAIGAAAFHYLEQQKEAASPEQLREVFD